LFISIIIIQLLSSSLAEYTIANNKQWRECIKNNQKACNPFPDKGLYFCWDIDEGSWRWGKGDVEGKWSDDSEFHSLPQTEYLVWPNDISCGDKTYDAEIGSTISIKADHIPAGGSCVYEISNYDLNSDSINISSSIANAEAKAYIWDEEEGYSYLDEIEDKEYNFLNRDILVILITSNDNEEGSFSADIEAIEVSKKHSKGLSKTVLFAIIIGSIFLFLLIVFSIAFGIKRRKNKRNRGDYRSMQEGENFSPTSNQMQVNNSQINNMVYLPEQNDHDSDRNS